jgi:H+/Cl- antiporter ClcA
MNALLRFIKKIVFENENIHIRKLIKKSFKEIITSSSMQIDVLSILFFLGKWLPFAIAVGITTGILASFMDLIVVWMNNYLSSNIIWFFVYPLMVSFIAGSVLHKYPQTGGPGIGYSILHLKRRGYISMKVILYKLFISVLTLSGGFIAGREGPSFFLGVAFGEWIGKIYGFSKKFKGLLGLIGGGAFTGALLKSPLGSSIFAMELENMYDFDYRPFIPMIVAAIVSYLTFSFFRGSHAFISLQGKPYWNLYSVPYIIMMGLIVSAVIYIYTIMFHSFQKISHAIPMRKRPFIGTLLAIPVLFAVYYITKNIDIFSAPANMKILSNMANFSFSIRDDIVITVGTMIITSLTLAFGMPGGLVLPVLIMGAAVGNAFGHFFPKELITFTLAGMGAALAAAAKTPLAAIVMITEMSHDDVVIPMTAAVITSYLTSFGYSTYLGQENIFKGNLRTFSSHWNHNEKR